MSDVFIPSKRLKSARRNNAPHMPLKQYARTCIELFKPDDKNPSFAALGRAAREWFANKRA